MFERYTERARRVIFFARYEASRYGSPTIETEYLLLGLIREDKNLTNRFLRSNSSVEGIRKEIEHRITIGEKISTTADLPLSNECKRILAYAAEEAERLNHRHIGTEHLLLGMLREEKCGAATILHERGVELFSLREELSRSAPNRGFMKSETEWPRGMVSDRMRVLVPDAATAISIAQAIWTPLFGENEVKKCSNLQARDSGLMEWLVTASSSAESRAGGQWYAVIRKLDGKVNSMGKRAESSDV